MTLEWRRVQDSAIVLYTTVHATSAARLSSRVGRSALLIIIIIIIILVIVWRHCSLVMTSFHSHCLINLPVRSLSITTRIVGPRVGRRQIRLSTVSADTVGPCVALPTVTGWSQRAERVQHSFRQRCGKSSWPAACYLVRPTLVSLTNWSVCCRTSLVSLRFSAIPCHRPLYLVSVNGSMHFFLTSHSDIFVFTVHAFVYSAIEPCY